MEHGLEIATNGEWLQLYGIRIALTLAVGLIYAGVLRFAKPRLTEGADLGGFEDGAAAKAIGVARGITGIAAALALALVWGIEFTSILVVAGTTLTLLGVALFASWSLLSNVTAHFVLLLHPTFRKGTFLRVIDGDNYIEGHITDLTLFNVKFTGKGGEIIVYPNNLVLGRPAVVNPLDRRQSMGKITAAPPPTTVPGTSA